MLRAGGVSELVGSIVISCTGSGSYGGASGSDIDVLLSAPYTGLITQTSGAWTEALLIVDDPATPSLGTNVYQGQLIAYNNLRFSGVTINPPGSGLLRMRIVNIRVAAPDPVGSQRLDATMVKAIVSMIRTIQIPINNPDQVVGFVQAGQRFQLLSTVGAPVASMTFPTGGLSSYRLRFQEGFADAFRKRNTAASVATPTAMAAQAEYGRNYGTESGFYAPGLGSTNGANLAGLASQGTRLVAVLTNIPSGVSLSASVAQNSNSASSMAARMVQTDDSGTGAYVAVTPGIDGRAPLTVTGGTARVVWEILASDPKVIESLEFDVAATYSGTPAGAATAAGAFAPASTNRTADASLPVPRFDTAVPGTQSGCATDCLVVPSAISFDYRSGDPAPAAIALPIGSTGGPLTFRVVTVSGGTAFGNSSPAGNWLSAAPSTGTTPASVLVAVQPQNLVEGNYSAVVNVTSGRYSENVFVFLRVLQPSVFESLRGCYTLGGVPPIVRANGVAEQVSDLVLGCYGSEPANTFITSDFRISLNTPITSRPGSPLLLTNEPYPAGSQAVGTNVFVGELQGSNTLLFRNVRVPGPDGGATILRFTNIFADASRIPVSGGATPSTITIDARSSAYGIYGAESTLAFILPAYTFRLLNSGLTTVSSLPISGAGTQQGSLEFREGHATSFKLRNRGTTFASPGSLLSQAVPGAIYSTETGFYNPALSGLETAGLATQGTRLMARFANVPAGVRLYVTVTETGSSIGSEKARLVQTDANGAGSYQEIPALSTPLFGGGAPMPAEVTLTGGSGMAVWEVTGLVSPLSVDTLRFGVLAVADGTGSGALAANGFLAPLSDVAVSDSSAPMPRFSTKAATGAICNLCVQVPESIALTSTSPSSTIPVTADIDPVPFTGRTQNAAWLRLDAGAGATPGSLTVTADPTGLAAGVYNGQVVVNSTVIPVTFSVASTSTTPEPNPATLSLSVERVELTFAKAGSVAAQTVRLDGTPGLPFQVTSNVPWLIVTPASGMVPATLTVTANTGAVPPGEYLALVTISAAGASQVLPVRVSVTETPQFLPTPMAVKIAHTAGEAPVTQVLYVTSRGRQTRYTAQAISEGGWLAVTPESGITPVNLRVTYNPVNLMPGTYTGAILLTSMDGAGPPLSVPVTLEIR